MAGPNGESGPGEYRLGPEDIRRDGSGEGNRRPSAADPGSARGRERFRPARIRKALRTCGVLALSLLCGMGGALTAARLGWLRSGTVLYESVPTRGEAVAPVTDVSDIVRKTQPSVVAITTEQIATSFFRQFVIQGAGSGVILSKDGVIVTNYHVIHGAGNITVTLADGQEYPAEVLGCEPENDLAVMKIAAGGLNPAVIGDSSQLAVGDFVLAIGNPLGTLSGTVTEGIVSALERQITVENLTMTLMQISAAVNPGNSGGGLFNARGELVGLVNAKAPSDSSGHAVDNIGFAIPINNVRNQIDDLITAGYVRGKIVLGLNLIEILSEERAEYYGVPEQGLYVQGVQNDSIAAIGGVRPGDRILRFAGREIRTYEDLADTLKNCRPDDRADLVVRRDGKDFTLSLLLTEQVPEQIRR